MFSLRKGSTRKNTISVVDVYNQCIKLLCDCMYGHTENNQVTPGVTRNPLFHIVWHYNEYADFLLSV